MFAIEVEAGTTYRFDLEGRDTGSGSLRDPVLRCLGAQLAISVHNCPVLADTRFPMSIFKRTQRKYVKKAYRVRNWREYEAGLRNRGSLTVWISLTAGKLVNWDAPRPRTGFGRGRSLPTGAGRSLRVFPYARSLRHRPAAPCYTTRR